MKEEWKARARDSALTKTGHSMFKRTSPFVAWGYLIFIAYATLSPAHLRPELTASEPSPVVIIEHVGAFGLLGLIFSAAYPHRLGFVCALVLAGAIALELLQFAIPDRDPRVVDAFEKLAGGAIGILAANWLSIKVQRQR
jgi:VanZ family protein